MRQKPTLLLLHGGPGGDHSTFKPVSSHLRDIARLVYLDHRGDGRSERGAPATWHLPQGSDDIRAFCDKAAIERTEIYDTFEQLGGAQAREVAVARWQTPSLESMEAYRSVCCPRGDPRLHPALNP